MESDNKLKDDHDQMVLELEKSKQGADHCKSLPEE